MRNIEKNKSCGFSLVEVMFVLAVLALFAAVIGPVYRSLQTKNNLDIAVLSIVQAFRRAEAQAQSGRADSNWGVSVANSSVTVFSGNSFASRQTAYDEVLKLPAAVTVSGLTEIVFNELSGLPQTSGTTTVANGFGSDQVGVTSAGAISY